LEYKPFVRMAAAYSTLPRRVCVCVCERESVCHAAEDGGGGAAASSPPLATPVHTPPSKSEERLWLEVHKLRKRLLAAEAEAEWNAADAASAREELRIERMRSHEAACSHAAALSAATAAAATAAAAASASPQLTASPATPDAAARFGGDWAVGLASGESSGGGTRRMLQARGNPLAQSSDTETDDEAAGAHLGAGSVAAVDPRHLAPAEAAERGNEGLGEPRHTGTNLEVCIPRRIQCPVRPTLLD
jgi:hypothetical protein